MDGGKPPPPAAAGEAGGRGRAGGDEEVPSTPVALNDAHASQAAKELEESVGLDLEAFLTSNGLSNLTAGQHSNQGFAVGTASASHGRSGKRTKTKNNNKEQRQEPPSNLPVNSSSDSVKPQAIFRKISIPLLPTAHDASGKGSKSGDKKASSGGDGGNKTSSAANETTSDAGKAGEDQGAGKGTEAPKPKRSKKRHSRSKNSSKTVPAAEKQTSNDEAAAGEPGTADSSEPANPWTKAREMLLKKKVAKQVNHADHDDRIRYKKFYDMAERDDYRVIPDAYPRRPITDDELQALYLWRSKKIHLREPPKFVEETHTLKERMAFAQIQRDLLTYSLHIDLPGHVRMPVETVKFHFYSRLLAKNQTEEGPTDRVIALMADVLSISVSVASRRAVLNFERPDMRDKWEGEVLRFTFGAVTLRAASYFEQEDKKHGIDKETTKMLFSFYFIGRPDLSMTTVHAMAEALSEGLPILTIDPVEPTGANTLDPHMWKVTLNSVDAPPGLEKTRELTVKLGPKQHFTIGVHQPRLATRHPCTICLDTTHFRNKCPNKETAAEKRAPFLREISVPMAPVEDHEPVAEDLAGFKQQLERLRAKLQPELSPATPAEPTPTAPSKPNKGESAPAEKKPKTKSGKSTDSRNSAQLEIIINAKTGVASDKKTKKPKKKSHVLPDAEGEGELDDAKQPDEEAPPGDTETYINKPARTKVAMPAIGAKRSHKEAYGQPAAATGNRGEPKEQPTKGRSAMKTTTPPTRQARTNKDGVDSTKADRPRHVDAYVFQHERPMPAKPRAGQLTMKSFLPKTAEPDVPNSPEVAIVGSKPAVLPTIKLNKLLDAISMTEVQVPANGSCWKSALTVAQAYECGEKVTVQMAKDVELARKLGKTINLKLAQKVAGMIADGTLEMVSLCSMILGKVVEHDSLKQLQAHFKEAAKQPADATIQRKYWGGEPEFKIFVEWVEEPLYVIDVMENGDCFPQWYHMKTVRSKDGSKVERAVVTPVSEASFRAHMGVYKRNHVVPLVLLLHHAMVGGTVTGHYNAARVSNATYKHWAGTTRRQDEMKQRLEKVVRVLNCMETDLEHHPFLDPSPPHTPGDGSVYEPADGDSTMEDSTQSEGSSGETTGQGEHQGKDAEHTDQTNTTSTGTSAERSSDGSQLNGSDAPSFNLLQHERNDSPSIPTSILTVLSLDSYPRFPSGALALMLPASITTGTPATPTHMPYGDQEDELIRKLQATPPYDPETTRSIKQVYKSNNTAYENWKARLKKEDPATYAIVRDVKGPINASERLQDLIGPSIQLVHNLPYPEIHVATMPSSVLSRLGQAASCVGQAQFIHRVQAHLSESSQAMCSTWVDALTADSTTADVRWRLSQATDKWARLEHAVSKAELVLPERNKHGIPDDEWCKLLAYVLIVPGCLPWAFVERPVPQRCDALAMWLAMNEQAEKAQVTADAIAKRQWLAARSLFPSLDYPDASSDSQASSLQNSSGETTAPTRY